MPYLQAYNIYHQFDNGERLFGPLSCVMTLQRVGLVGRNGVGKSVLASILCGERESSGGSVTSPHTFAVYRQQRSELLSGTESIAQYLGLDHVLAAINKIESGDCSEHWFEIVGEQWDLANQLARQLDEIGLPPEPDFACAQLSGGQLARLQLWRLFNSQVPLLILDEPSNHLDADAKQWLIASMRQFSGAILLISHDRSLLREMDEIWELSSLGLQTFGGNYDTYAEQKRAEQQAVERQLACVEKQSKHIEKQAQRNREKAQQRAAQGNKLRKEGSQAKILLDSKKNKATASASNRNKNQQHRREQLQDKSQSLQARKEQNKSQTLYLADAEPRARQVICMRQVRLLFGLSQPITMQVYALDKVHLQGGNGCGKSTLLKTLLGQFSLQSGELQVNTPLYYLDQHFALIRSELSMLDNLMHYCEGMNESDARTLLAGIGFRRDSVFRPGSVLSGGEKMKLSMLIVSHQPSQPLLLLDEPDNHLDLTSKQMLAQALANYRGGFILVSHDADFAQESGVQRQITLS
ncbi:ATP-binding cassette domain-containing protein [Vibrio sp. WXL103]|uniref:ATP-binding cassette domain-containing protein n=1 Tax=Vibrio sp. WXL103 TaxID=3450710 RepID=UPI003EC8DED6